MRGADEFGISFQRQLVVAMLSDHGLKSLVYRFIASGQIGWTDPASLWVWQLIREDDNPSKLKLKTERGRLYDDDPAVVGADEIIEATDDWRDCEYVRDQVVEWARKQVFQTGFEEARKSWNENNIDEAQNKMLNRIEEMSAIRLDSADRGWFFSELEDRQYRRQSLDTGNSGFPCGIEKIDNAMRGGLSYGEFEVVMAYSGIGKTFWCVQRGFLAARLRSKVLHFVLEAGRSRTEDRYEARFSDKLYSKVRSGELDSETLGALAREYRLLGRNLVIRGFNDGESWRATYDDILVEIKELRMQHGWVPELIIVDYGDLLHSAGDNEYMRQKTSFRKLKALSERIEFRGHKGYAVCSPTQAVRPTRGADESEHILLPRDVADCFEKARIADVILSLNRTLEEKEDSEARVYLSKHRDTEDGLLVKVRTDYAHGAFSDLSYDE